MVRKYKEFGRDVRRSRSWESNVTPPAYHRPIIPVFMAKSIGDKTCRHSQTRDNRPKAREWNSDETRLTD